MRCTYGEGSPVTVVKTVALLSSVCNVARELRYTQSGD